MDKIYISDSPIETPEFDRFNRWVFAERIAEVIANRSDLSSLVISVCGAWGEGKTSVLNFIEGSLTTRHKGSVICIQFNPWRFISEDYILQAFFEGVSKSLYDVTGDEEIKERLNKYYLIISSKADLSNANSSTKDDLKDLKYRVEEILKKHKKRVVILIDDLDRLDKNEIQAVFRLVKLTADFSYTTYILAFDDEVVAGAVSEKYGSGSIKDGKKFLEKIIQIPLLLPKADSFALQKFISQCLEEALEDAQVSLEATEMENLRKVFFPGLEPFITTPRLIKRYGQILAFSLSTLRGEVNNVDLILLEAVRIFHSKLYNVIRANPDYFSYQLNTRTIRFGDTEKKKFRERRRQYIEDALEGLTYFQREASEKLVEFLFPGFNSIFCPNAEDSKYDTQWSKEQRLISGKYFDRYFSYAISENDISDNKISSFLNRIVERSTEAIGSEIRQIATHNNVDRFIEKLRLKEEELPKDIIEKLVLAIATIGDLFPPYQVLFSIDRQASVLICQLIKKLPSKVQFRLSKQVIQTSNPVSFSVECFLSITQRGDTKKTISDKQKNELFKEMVQKIKKAASESVIYVKFKGIAGQLLYFWARENPAEAKQYVKDTLEKDSNNIFRLIREFFHTDYDGEILNGSEGYKLIRLIADVDFISQILQPFVSLDPSSLSESDVTNNTLARNFLRLHQDLNQPQGVSSEELDAIFGKGLESED